TRRVARLRRAAPPQDGPLGPEAIAADSLLSAVQANPPVLLGDISIWNTDRYRRAEIAGAGAHGAASSLARLFARPAHGRLLRPAAPRAARRAVGLTQGAARATSASRFAHERAGGSPPRRTASTASTASRGIASTTWSEKPAACAVRMTLSSASRGWPAGGGS